MEYLILYIITVVSSFCLQIKNEFRLYKDVADSGYKINVERMSEALKALNPNGNKKTLLSMLIPLYNLVTVMERVLLYNSSRDMLLDQLRVMGVLQEMSELEQKEYEKHPTALNAIMIPIKTEIRYKNASSIKTDNGKIVFDFYKGDITILSSEGELSNLSEEEQKKYIVEQYVKTMLAGAEIYNGIDGFTKAIENAENSITLDVSSQFDNVQSKRSKQIQDLQNFKNELLEEEINKKENNDKRISLKKRK